MDRLVPYLEKAGIPLFGECCAFSSQTLNSKIAFPLNGGSSALAIGGGALAAKECKTPVIVVASGPGADFSVGLYQQGLKSGGAKAAPVIQVAPEGGDYTAQVTQALKGHDCIVGGLAEDGWATWLQATQQAGGGGGQKVFGSVGNLTAANIKAFPKLTQGGYNASYYPICTDPVWNNYWAAWDKYGTPKKYTTLCGIGALAAWVGIVEMQDVVKGIPADQISAKTVLAKLNTFTDLDTHGLTPPINFTKPLGFKGFTRLFNTTVVFSTFNNGVETKAFDGKFFDFAPVLNGKPLAGL